MQQNQMLARMWLLDFDKQKQRGKGIPAKGGHGGQSTFPEYPRGGAQDVERSESGDEGSDHEEETSPGAGREGNGTELHSGMIKHYRWGGRRCTTGMHLAPLNYTFKTSLKCLKCEIVCYVSYHHHNRNPNSGSDFD